MSKTPLRDDLLAALAAGPLTINQAAAAVNTQARNAQEAMKRMCELGLIRRKGSSRSPNVSATFVRCDPAVRIGDPA